MRVAAQRGRVVNAVSTQQLARQPRLHGGVRGAAQVAELPRARAGIGRVALVEPVVEGRHLAVAEARRVVAVGETVDVGEGQSRLPQASVDGADRKDVRRVLVPDQPLFFDESSDPAVLQKTRGRIPPVVIADDVHDAEAILETKVLPRRERPAVPVRGFR